MKNKNPMKKTVLSLLAVLMFCFVDSNVLNAQIQIPDSLRQYYNYIDSAEILIMDAKYNKASDFYQKAFSYKQKAFGIDIYNAAVCESKIPNYQNTYTYLKELIAKGYSIETLKKKKCFNDFFTSKYGKKLSKKAHSFKNEYDEIYRAKLDSLYYADQKIAHKYSSYINQPIENIDSIQKKILWDSLHLVYYKNSICLEKLINTKGFPSEFRIGMDSSFLLWQAYKIIIHHANRSQKRHSGELAIINFTDYINKAIENGDIPNSFLFYLLCGDLPTHLAFESYSITKVALIPSSSHTTYKERHNLLLNNDSSLTVTKWSYYPLDSAKAEQAKEILGLFAMGTAENIRKKILFNEKNKDFVFEAKYGSKNIYWLDESQFQLFTKKLIPIE